jgi:hypothetical protein
VLKKQQELAQAKYLFLMRKHTASELKDPKKRAKFYDSEIHKATLSRLCNKKNLKTYKINKQPGNSAIWLFEKGQKVKFRFSVNCPTNLSGHN